MAAPEKNQQRPGEATLRQALDLSCEGVLILRGDPESPAICYANSQFTRLSGFTLEELASLRWADVCHDIGADDVANVLLTRDSYCDTLLMESADGTRWRSGVRIRTLIDDAGDADSWLCQFIPPSLMGGESDLASIWFDPDCAGSRHRFGRLDRIDSSSGLLRFERFRDFFERDIAMAARENKRATLILLQILEFSEYRSTFGVNAANSCLSMIGKQVTATLRRRTDLCGRMDDDTIIAAVVGQSGNDVSAILERICDNVDGLRIHNPRGRYSRFLTLRCAVTCVDQVPHDCSFDSLLESAQNDLKKSTAETLSA